MAATHTQRKEALSLVRVLNLHSPDGAVIYCAVVAIQI